MSFIESVCATAKYTTSGALNPTSCHTLNFIQGHTMSQVRVVGFSMALTHEDLVTLDGLNWLNDQVRGRIKSVKSPFVLTQMCDHCA